ncbi:hypothetical protein JCM11641_007277 [Rhodosporidiobolus odoratus]
MSRSWDLWLTPTVTLSLILEAESPLSSFTRWAAQWALWLRPALLKGALQYEIALRGDTSSVRAASLYFAEAYSVISTGTLRIVDYAYFREQAGSASDTASQSTTLEALGIHIATSEGIDVPSVEYDLLAASLTRVLHSYAIVERAVALAETAYPPPGEDGNTPADALLLELWEKLRPETEYPGSRGKHWQQLGFQNTSPATDFRGVGMLGLHVLLYFARVYGARASEIVDESVGGGERWYPLALASLHMTAFALELGKSRDLQLFLLRSLQTSSSSASSSNLAFTEDPPPLVDVADAMTPLLPERTSSPSRHSYIVGTLGEAPDLEAFLTIASDLLLLFHAHWRQSNFRVMEFEQASRSFQSALRPWIRRGVLDGRALGWETWEEGAVKLD